MASMSKDELMNLQKEFLNSELPPTNSPIPAQVIIAPCLVASFFQREEVVALVNALNCDFVKVFLIKTDDGKIKMGMAGADLGRIDPEGRVIPSATLFPDSTFFEAKGLISDIDCPPRCQDDEFGPGGEITKRNSLYIVSGLVIP